MRACYVRRILLRSSRSISRDPLSRSVCHRHAVPKARLSRLRIGRGFMMTLVKSGMNVVVIPDPSDVLGPQNFASYGWRVHLPSSIDLRMRLALYQRARMNVCTGPGPGTIACYAEAPVLVFERQLSGINERGLWTRVGGADFALRRPWFRTDQYLMVMDATHGSMSGTWGALKFKA